MSFVFPSTKSKVLRTTEINNFVTFALDGNYSFVETSHTNLSVELRQ